MNVFLVEFIIVLYFVVSVNIEFVCNVLYVLYGWIVCFMIIWFVVNLLYVVCVWLCVIGNMVNILYYVGFLFILVMLCIMLLIVNCDIWIKCLVCFLMCIRLEILLVCDVKFFVLLLFFLRVLVFFIWWIMIRNRIKYFMLMLILNCKENILERNRKWLCFLFEGNDF